MISDKRLEETAKALNEETYVVDNFGAVGETAVTISTSDTDLPDQLSSRYSLTKIRTGTQVQASFIRPAIDVIDTTNGDDIKWIGSFVTNTGSDLMESVSSSINQTDTFDIEFVFTLEADRG